MTNAIKTRLETGTLFDNRTDTKFCDTWAVIREDNQEVLCDESPNHTGMHHDSERHIRWS